MSITRFTGYQKFVVATLTFVQFTVVMDFMILSPLGAILMPELNITPAQFGYVVSAYAFSAGLAGFLAAGFADRFDRKRLLLFFYTGFVVGTLLCGLAPNYPSLFAARIVAGLFGGVLSSINFAIITDLFEFEKRGRVMGFVQSAFAASQVLGIPAGLYLANHLGWQSAFISIVVIASCVGIVVFRFLKPIRGHLNTSTDKNALSHLMKTVSKGRYLYAFSATALLAVGGFMIMPFSSAFNVNNLGLRMDQLPFIYLFTGATAMIAGPLIGRFADRVGKFNVFSAGATITTIAIYLYCHLTPRPLVEIVLVNMFLFIGISARIISSQALVSSIPEPQDRGAFMSVSNSIQQVSGGFASILAGWIVYESPTGKLERFPELGWVVIISGFITWGLLWGIHRSLPKSVRN